MRTLKRKLKRSGFSLIEALIAGAILIVGLTGITMMLIRGSVNARNGQQAAESTSIVTAELAKYQSLGFDSLTVSPMGLSFDAGTALDGGFFIDTSGRRYNLTYIVNDITGSMPMGAVLIPTYSVDVEIAYRDGVGRMIYRRGGTIISRTPDAGP